MANLKNVSTEDLRQDLAEVSSRYVFKIGYTRTSGWRLMNI